LKQHWRVVVILKIIPNKQLWQVVATLKAVPNHLGWVVFTLKTILAADGFGIIHS
jgi:hypothetical protein